MTAVQACETLGLWGPAAGGRPVSCFLVRGALWGLGSLALAESPPLGSCLG
jgi:hypothetical protein